MDDPNAKPNNIHTGHRARLKQRFLEAGLDALDDITALELVLFFGIPRKDTNPVAHALLDRFGSLPAVLEAPVLQLRQVPGMTEQAAVLLRVIPEMARRYQIRRSDMGKVLNSITSCGNYLLPYFFGAREELVYLLSLDAKCKVLDCRCISRGGVNSAEISVRRVVEIALAVNATSVVLAHNHTSGIALPSQEDAAATRQLITALNAVGIILADHIVVADDDFVSMADNGFFNTY